MPEKSVLVLSDVTFTYAKEPVLWKVNLELAAGEIVALVGRNGAGKSTLLRCAAGWSAPTEGRVEALGQQLREAERSLRRDLVLVTDTPAFYDDLTAREHIRFVLRANRLEERTSEAERLLEAFGLGRASSAYPSTFSRGMRYKLALVMALALRPRVLLLDEPFGPIDPVSAGELWEELRALANAGSAILLSSHQFPAGEAPDRYYVLDNGAIISEGDCRTDGAERFAASLDAILVSAIDAAEPSHDA